MVTHDQAEAMTLADRIVVMNDRKIQQVGPPMEIYTADPRHSANHIPRTLSYRN